MKWFDNKYIKFIKAIICGIMLESKLPGQKIKLPINAKRLDGFVEKRKASSHDFIGC